jgi:hypothetical protein
MDFPQIVELFFSYLSHRTLFAPMRVVSLTALVSPFRAVALLLARLMPVDALTQKVTRQFLNAWGCAYGRTSAFIFPEALQPFENRQIDKNRLFAGYCHFSDLLTLVKHTDFICMGLTYDQYSKSSR